MKKPLTPPYNIIKIILLLFCFLSFTNVIEIPKTGINKDERLANAYYLKQQYSNALTYYRKAWLTDKEPRTLRKIITCHLILSQYEKGLKEIIHLKKITSLVEEDYEIYLKLLQSTGRYEEMKDLISIISNKEQNYLWYLQSADSSIKWMESEKYQIINCEIINTKYSENSPMIYEEGLVFSSNREQLTERNKYGFDNYDFLDFYQSKGKEVDFTKPTLFSSKINSKGHEAAISFNSDFTKAYFTRSEHTQKENEQHSEKNRAKLFMSTKTKLGWSNSIEFALNDSSFSFSHPFISEDENFFFFSSDMDGGYGGADLYFCKKLSTGKWSRPKNLGPKVNTNKHEAFAFFDVQSQTLTFSSNGHVGMGGYDLYTSEYKESDWCAVENLKSPINSSYDELSLVWGSYLKTAYLCSNRKGGKGSYDIYWVDK